MRKLAVCLAAVAIAIGCRPDDSKKQAPPFDGATFLAVAMQSALSDGDLGAMASHKGALPETRRFGAVMQREQQRLLAALSAVARSRGIAVPTAVEEKRQALKDNLGILPGQVFDRAYALAMMQDAGAMTDAYRAASYSGDRNLESFAAQNLPIVAAEQKSAAALLDRLGGSPFQ
jgi:putative membrane protein